MTTPNEPVEPCKHLSKISSCGIKVCFDCGAPLNAKAKAVSAIAKARVVNP